MQQISGPKTLWATHLANSLKGEAKQYAGDATNWFDKYNELWETLDSKYANRWLLATETIRNFFSKPPPKDNLQAVKDFFFDQLQALNNVLALKMEVEHIGVNHIIENLPDKYRSELQNGLRVLQPGQTNAAFSRKTVKNVFNDTIGVKTEQPTPPKGTLSFLAQTTGGSAPCSQGLQIPHPNNNPYSMCQPQYQTQVQQAQNDPQAWEGRGNNFYYHNGSPFIPPVNSHPQVAHAPAFTRGAANVSTNTGAIYKRSHTTPLCTLCTGEDAVTHNTFNCSQFPTPESKRNKLLELTRCPDCAGRLHDGVCKINYCPKHPGQKHYWWLCCDPLQSPNNSA